MGEHIIDDEFKSDKYPWCKSGFVPLKLTDEGAWKPLWDYAQQRRVRDPEFSDDLEAALFAKGFKVEDAPRSDTSLPVSEVKICWYCKREVSRHFEHRCVAENAPENKQDK